MIAEAGQRIAGVVLHHKIADGGMGSVWAGEHVTLRREVAVKFLSADRLAEPEAVQRFAMEGRTMARIQSPYVPQVFDQGECPDGTPYIVMELLEGAHLGSWVADHGPLDVEQVARILDQVGLALTAAHELGIVHRDVKPENIILRGEPHDFTAKLLDFGIAKSVGLLLHAPLVTLTGTTMGTASYMSPEQVRSSTDVDERTDVWSLAVVAYLCLTGQLPFEGETFSNVCLAIHRGHFTPVSELMPDLPADLDVWFRKALDGDVERRFSSTAVMSRMFKVAAATVSALAPLVTPSVPPVAIEAIERIQSIDPVGEAPAVGVVHAQEPDNALPPKRRRSRTALYAAVGAILGTLTATGILLAPVRNATAALDGGSHAEPKALAAGPWREVAATPPPQPAAPWSEVAAIPLAPAPPSPVATPTPSPLPSAAPAQARVPARTVVTFNHRPDPIAAATAHAGPPDAGPAVDAAPAVTVVDPTEWHPTDELGEP